MVTFTKDGHKYHFEGEQYKSVSALFKPYQTFDRDTESFRMALKRIDPEMYAVLSKRYGYKSGNIVSDMLGVYDRSEIEDIQLQILSEWDTASLTSTERGTRMHELFERRDIDNGGRMNPYTKEWSPYVNVRLPGFDNNSVHFLSDLEDGYYPELLLFNHDHKLAGQADMVYIKTEGSRRLVWIDDWKTDQKIETKSFYTRRYGYTFMHSPLDHVHDSNFWTYALKISTYGWMLEDAGFEVAELGFTHVGGGEKGGDYLYRVPYMKKEVETVLNPSIHEI